MKYSTWTNVILFFSISIIIGFLYKKFYHKKMKMEGFTQKEQFVLNKDENIYDDFYSKIYDKVTVPTRRVDFEIDTVLKSTQADTTNSVILDIGSGTGFLVNKLNQRGYKAYGLDKSTAMVEQSNQKYPDISVKIDDASNTMCYDKSTFSHIFCVYFTIYSIKDRIEFFRNCHFWLKPGGCLVLHLVDPLKFDVTAPCAKDVLFGSPRRFLEEKSNDSIVSFDDYKYKLSYKYNNENKEAIMTESIIDLNTNRVRQNEQVLFMDDIQTILSELNYCGFISNAKFVYNEDKHQYLFLIERD